MKKYLPIVAKGIEKITNELWERSSPTLYTSKNGESSIRISGLIKNSILLASAIMYITSFAGIQWIAMRDEWLADNPSVIEYQTNNFSHPHYPKDGE